VVIGASTIVGKLLALVLFERECTVSVTHIHIVNLAEIAREADILIAAPGAPGVVRGDWVKPGAVVIDIGINRVRGAQDRIMVVGNCATQEFRHANARVPVPGGVGPMPFACLPANTFKADRLQHHA
jgi:methylenetetrahydrofolate dehydrogenase (NADP+) / methenyltetrahydrofolate cyclohydrolase